MNCIAGITFLLLIQLPYQVFATLVHDVNSSVYNIRETKKQDAERAEITKCGAMY